MPTYPLNRPVGMPGVDKGGADGLVLFDLSSTELTSAAVQVAYAPVVLKAYGLRVGETLQVFNLFPGTGVTAPYMRDGAAVVLSDADNTEVLYLTGYYQLLFSGPLGQLLVTATALTQDQSSSSNPSSAMRQSELARPFPMFPDGNIVSPKIEVGPNPIVVRAYGLSGSQEVIVLNVFSAHGVDTVEQVVRSGVPLKLDVTNNTIVLDVAGYYQLQLASDLPNLKVTTHETASSFIDPYMLVATEAAAQAAANSAIAAGLSESAAFVSETNAGVSETNAYNSEVNAGTSETNAYNSEQAAGISEVNAHNSEIAAGTSEVNAGTSETNAGLSEIAAGTSEVNAGLSEVAAGTSEINAGTSETNAGLSEIAAGTSEVNAGLSEVAAGTSEINAGLSEGVALVQAGIATTQASNAAVSAGASATSATGASGSAIAAGLSAAAAQAAVTSPRQHGTATIGSAAGVVSIDLSADLDTYYLTLTENVTAWDFTGLPAAGRVAKISVVLQQDASAKTCVSPASPGKTSGGPWTVSATVNSVQWLNLVVNSSGVTKLLAEDLLG